MQGKIDERRLIVDLKLQISYLSLLFVLDNLFENMVLEERYLSRIGLITCSLEQLQTWFESQEKKQNSENPNKILKKKKNNRRNNFNTRESTRVKTKLQTQELSSVLVPKVSQPTLGINPGEREMMNLSTQARSSIPLVCGLYQKQYKNIRSYRTHMYQVHMKQVQEDSSHNLNGKHFTQAVPYKPNPSARTDHSKQPSQDRKVFQSEPKQRDFKMIEERSQGPKIHGRKTNNPNRQSSTYSTQGEEEKAEND